MVVLPIAVFAGAFLLFLVQPLIAKQILPWFGGAPAVWSTCLVFFQLTLVVGYAYAHVTRRFGLRAQAVVHLTLLVAALSQLPITPSPDLKPDDAGAPSWLVIVLLAKTVGFPYVLLAATAPMLQSWYAAARPGQTPYGLYALSNAGSLVALVSFPILIEPLLGSAAQARVWSIGFVFFLLATAWSAWSVIRRPASESFILVSGPASPTALDRLLWYSLAACGTGLLLSVTNQLCQEVASVPLLWVVPLALYLVTFIISFASFSTRVPRAVWVTVFIAFAIGTAYVMANAASMGLLTQTLALLGLLFGGCMICHGELSRLKPAPVYLTSFYLAISIGGGLGGLFVALAAPVVFRSYAELPLFVLMTAVLAIAVGFRDVAVRNRRPQPVMVWAVPMFVFLATAGSALDRGDRSPAVVATGRSFYGVLRVVDSPPGSALPRRGLFHGRVLHGAQFLDANRRFDQVTDFAAGSGISQAFAVHPRRVQGQPLTVGVVGLGAGAIAAFGRAGDSIRFYELNPQVIEFARTHFTYLRESPASVEVVAGDARVSLEREMVHETERHRNDVLIVDAFAGASIPVHLLTRESFQLYRQALAVDGVLAVHVSNQHLDLVPVVRGAAAELGWRTIVVARRPDAAIGATASMWAVMSPKPELLANITTTELEPRHEVPDLVWTDAFSSVTSVLSFAPQWYLRPSP